MDLAGDIVQPIKMTNRNVQIQFEGTVFNVPIMPANAFEAEKLMPEKPKEVWCGVVAHERLTEPRVKMN